MSKYAAGTKVDSFSSRAEIERTLHRYGATGFMYGWEHEQAVIGFKIHNRQVRFLLPLPDRNSREFTHTPSRGQARSAEAADAAYEQAVRQSWRALALVVKAKLEAVDSGIVTFDQEFLAHLVLPGTGGHTVFEEVGPKVVEAIEEGTALPMLQLPK